jgi:hypothetical protein
MPLDPRQRHAVLKADRTKDASWVRAVIEQLRSADPTVTLLEVEQTLRAAAGSAFLVADGPEFRIVIGMPAWVAELDRLGRTPEQNRQALAGEPNSAD